MTQLSTNPIKQTSSQECVASIRAFLKANFAGTLATVSKHSRPHASVVYFATDNDFNIHFLTKHDTQKYRNIMHNNRVVLVAYEPFTQTTVEVSGAATEVNSGLGSAQVFKEVVRTASQSSEAGIPPISKIFAGRYAAFTIRPTYIRMASFSRPSTHGFDIYDTIEFGP